MKRSLLILTLLSFATLCLAESRVWVSPLEIKPGEHANLRVNYQFDEGHTICNYQMKVNLPEGVTVDGTDVVLGSCHTTHTGSIVNNVLVVMSMNAVLQGTSGMLVEIPVVADNNLTVGTQLEGNLENVKLGQTNETSINSTGITFDVDIVDYILLDENSISAPISTASAQKLKVRRTINANEWSTICLPFAMTETQVKAAFGDDVQIGEFEGTDSEFDSADNVIGIKANFSNASAIEANHPYIIKVSAPVTEFTLDGVDIVADEDEAYIEFDNGKTGSRRVVYSGFYGTYHAGTVLDKFTLFLNDNKFWYSTGSTKMKAFRAYFAFLDVLTDVEDAYSSRITIAFNDDVTTGISLPQPLQKEGCLYDLQGRRVQEAGKGLYIQNGKKVVIK